MCVCVCVCVCVCLRLCVSLSVSVSVCEISRGRSEKAHHGFPCQIFIATHSAHHQTNVPTEGTLLTGETEKCLCVLCVCLCVCVSVCVFLRVM